MLINIVKSDTKALAEIFSNKEFLRSVDGNKEKYKNYLVGLVSKNFFVGYHNEVTLPKEIIPDVVTLNAFTFTYKKDSSTLPILLRYFTHKNLLKEAKDDLDEINQKLQSVMDKDLTDLQGKQKKLQEDTVKLVGAVIGVKQAEALDINSKKITKISLEIEKLELYKEDIETLLRGGEVKLRPYPSQYLSILNSGLIGIMEKKLTAYVKDNKDNTDIEKAYQSLNSKAERITMIKLIYPKLGIIIICLFLLSIFSPLCWHMIWRGPALYQYFPCALLAASSAIIAGAIVGIGIVESMERHYEQSFIKEMQGFIEGSKHIDQATNTEESKFGLDLYYKKPPVDDLIDLSDDGKKDEVQPSEPPFKPADLSEDFSAQPSSNLDSFPPPSNTARDITQR